MVTLPSPRHAWTRPTRSIVDRGAGDLVDALGLELVASRRSRQVAGRAVGVKGPGTEKSARGGPEKSSVLTGCGLGAAFTA
jgi:hypothetical protein